MAQTKADRSAAAKKAAATRKRNQAKAQTTASKDSAGSTVENLVGAAKSAGDAAVKASKSVATRVRGS